MPVTIRNNATGDTVALLQECLNNYGYGLTADGVLEAVTATAVRRFQHVMGIGVDGVVGNTTWQHLQRTPGSLIELLRASAIRMPDFAVTESVTTNTRLACACVLLTKESSGGTNVYGHDAVKCDGTPRGGPVTEENYLLYKANRSTCGAQGVGPVQLTWPGFQDRADTLGGCWRPAVNIRVGLDIFSGYMRAGGMRTAYRRYNGSGAAAERYADDAMSRTPGFQQVISTF